MARWWRWLVVVSGVAALVAMPSVVGALPVRGGRDAGDLLARIQGSRSTPYDGYAESAGGLALPVSGQLTSVVDLLGGRTQMRVWWRAADDWRVDTVGLTGERGVHRGADGIWTWDYEDNRATISSDVADGAVRLPAAADALPSEMGRRFLGAATASEVSGLPARRIAGREADGLRLRPGDPWTSVARVDVWADRASGIPLRVELFGVNATRPAMSAGFLDFSARTPTAAQTAFTPPPSARVRSGSRFDLVDLVSQISGPEPPVRLLGMARNDLLVGGGSIGVYGRGVTELVAAPMPRRQARSFREQLMTAPGVKQSSAGLSLAVGPLGLLLTTPDEFGRTWLLTGTVTAPALTKAAGELAASRRGSP